MLNASGLSSTRNLWRTSATSLGPTPRTAAAHGAHTGYRRARAEQQSCGLQEGDKHREGRYQHHSRAISVRQQRRMGTLTCNKLIYGTMLFIFVGGGGRRPALPLASSGT